MDTPTVETGLRRGVWCWLLFCGLSTAANLSGLSTQATATIFLILPPLVVATIQHAQQRVKPAVGQKSYFITNTIALVFGIIHYIFTALVLPSWDASLKFLITTAFFQTFAQLFRRASNPQSVWAQFQWVERFPILLLGQHQKAQQINNRFLRIPTLALAYVAYFAVVSVIIIWAVNFDFLQFDLPWLRIAAREYRLRLRTYLFHRIIKHHVRYHVYRPLQSESGTAKRIRLLRLYKRRLFRELECELIEADLREVPPYDAISYHWGKGERTEPISVGGQTMLVSSTVLAALYHLGSYETDRFVWIDSICINQQDNEEKGHQVSMMRDIYRNARKTVVWLNGVDEPPKVRAMLAGLWYEYTYGTTESCAVRLRQYADSRSESGWVQLMNTFVNPWFFRVWVIQEVAMASKVEVLASGEPLSWEHLGTVSEMLYAPPFNQMLQSSKLPGINDVAIIGVFHLMVMMARHRHRDEGNYLKLISFLDMTTSFAATEPIDRIYALFGMLNPTNGIHDWVTTDYTKSTEQVYTLVAQYSITSNPGEVLSNAGIGYDRQLRKLPSWVPDWTSLSFYGTRRQTFTHSSVAARYRASADSLLDIEFPPTPETGDSPRGTPKQILRIRGYTFDKISHIGPTMAYVEDTGVSSSQDEAAIALEFLRQHARARRLAATYARDPYPYPYTTTGQQSLEDAFWRTLIGDTQMARPAPAELGLYCRLWERMMEARLEGKMLKREDEEEGLRRDNTNPLPAMAEINAMGLGEESLRSVLLWNSARIMCCTGRAFAITRSGYMAMVPPGTAVGDAVCVLYGVETPFILRSLPKDSHGEHVVDLVGEAYVHGAMDGEAMQDSGDSQVYNII